MQSLLLPITQLTVSGSQWPRGLCGDQTKPHRVYTDGNLPSTAQLRDGFWLRARQEMRPQRHLRASTVSPILIFETLHSGGCCFGEILVSPSIGPLDCAPAGKVGKLTSPVQNLPSFLRRECPYHAD
jgi:hypothetical protein